MIFVLLAAIPVGLGLFVVSRLRMGRLTREALRAERQALTPWSIRPTRSYSHPRKGF